MRSFQRSNGRPSQAHAALAEHDRPAALEPDGHRRQRRAAARPPASISAAEPMSSARRHGALPFRRRMRILYLHQFFITRAGVGGTRSYEFARRFVDRGHAVRMVTAASGSHRGGRHRGGGRARRLRRLRERHRHVVPARACWPSPASRSPPSLHGAARAAAGRDLRHLAAAHDRAPGAPGRGPPPRAARVRGARPLAGGPDPDGGAAQPAGAAAGPRARAPGATAAAPG